MNCGVGLRCGLDLAAAALIRPLAQKLPYAACAALKKLPPPQKKKIKKRQS